MAGVWGGKGQGKSFQTELIFKAMGIEPIIMSAGEMESEWAGLFYDGTFVAEVAACSSILSDWELWSHC